MKYAKTEVLLDVQNVSLKLGGKQILRDINFQIQNIVRPDMIQGQIVALIGASGAGKSTLFSLMAGLRQPDTGTVTAFGKPVKIGDMGIVYQNYYITPWRRVRMILTQAAEKNRDNIVVKEHVAMIAEDFRLQDHLDKFPKELSGGQQQRVAIAEQILTGSEFLLLDEPFSGLDIITIDKVVGTLRNTANIDELKTLVVVSHDLSNAVAIADTVYVLARDKYKVGDPYLGDPVPGDYREGGTIVKTIDLIERDLAWHPEVKDMPAFKETLLEIKSLL